MLDGLLSGGKLDQKDTEAIRALTLKLEEVHRRAIETDRETTFSTRETYQEILTKKLPFFAHRWSKITADSEERRFFDPTERELGFTDFICYIRKENKILMLRAGFLTQNQSAPSTKDGAGAKNSKSAKVAATNAEVAATGVEVAATTTSRPKSKGPVSKGNSFDKKSYANATKQAGNKAPGAAQDQKKSSPPGKKPDNCVACKNGSHELSCCTEFLKKSKSDRHELVKKNGLCFLCLSHGHLSAGCPEEVKCDECNGKHNTLFHREKTEEEA